MTNLTISIPDAVAAKLQKQARSEGKDAAAYVSEIVANAVARSAVDELLAPVREEFAASGLSETEIMSLGRRELDALRRERKAKST